MPAYNHTLGLPDRNLTVYSLNFVRSVTKSRRARIRKGMVNAEEVTILRSLTKFNKVNEKYGFMQDAVQNHHKHGI